MELLQTAQAIGGLSGYGVVGLFIYILYRDGVLRFSKNGKENGNGKNGAATLSAQMSELKEHYNHETTQLLREIRDATTETNRKLSEWEKYGTPPPRNKL